jgi:hypothetical protein
MLGEAREGGEVEASVYRSRGASIAIAFLLAPLLISPACADDAKIVVSSATAGSSLGGRLIEGVMTFHGRDYLLTLRGIAESVTTVGAVGGLLRTRDIEGTFEPSVQGLRNSSGVTIRFEPPLSLVAGRLEIEVSRRMSSPKVSGGAHAAGVE